MNAGNDLGDPNIASQNPGTFGTNDTINFNIAGAGVKTINVGSTASASGMRSRRLPKRLRSTATRNPALPSTPSPTRAMR